jgi:hypothetical protein
VTKRWRVGRQKTVEEPWRLMAVISAHGCHFDALLSFRLTAVISTGGRNLCIKVQDFSLPLEMTKELLEITNELLEMTEDCVVRKLP